MGRDASVAVVLPLVGREQDLAELREHITHTAGGAGRLVLLGGEAGPGERPGP